MVSFPVDGVTFASNESPNTRTLDILPIKVEILSAILSHLSCNISWCLRSVVLLEKSQFNTQLHHFFLLFSSHFPFPAFCLGYIWDTCERLSSFLSICKSDVVKGYRE